MNAFVNSVNALGLWYLSCFIIAFYAKLQKHNSQYCLWCDFYYLDVAFYLFNKIPHHLVIFPRGDKGGGIY